MASARAVTERSAAVRPVPEHGRALDGALRVAAYVVLIAVALAMFVPFSVCAGDIAQDERRS